MIDEAEGQLTKNDPVFSLLERFNVKCEEVSALKQQLAQASKEKEEMSYRLVEAYNARGVKSINVAGENFYLNKFYTCSTIGASIEDTESWAEQFGHLDVVKKQIESQRFKSLAIQHMFGDPQDPNAEPWWGDCHIPEGAKIESFERVVKKGR